MADIGVDQIDDLVGQLLVENHPHAITKNGREPNRLAPHSINNVLGVLGRILTAAHRRGAIPSRPLIEKLPIDYPDEVVDILAREEVTRLFAACDGVHGRMLKTGVLTGCRVGEGARHVGQHRTGTGV